MKNAVFWNVALSTERHIPEDGILQTYTQTARHRRIKGRKIFLVI
jgi:hypothetical protein